jgi:ABC-2 type transport system permease protein
MTVAQQTPPSEKEQPRSSTLRNGRWAGFLHILDVRLRELWREPEVVFWVFGFPILLALGLGIAFRDKPAEIVRVVVVSSPESQNAVSMIQRAPGGSSIHTDVLDEPTALRGFRLGKYDLVIESNNHGGYVYRYDPARPESVFARARADDSLQAAAGRKDPVPTAAVASTDPGSRYIDFLIPGLLGMNLMNAAMWGIGFALVDMRQRKLLKRFVATPMRRSDFLLALLSSRLVLMLVEVGLLLGFGVLAFHMRILGSPWTILLIGAIGAISFGGLGLLTASRAQKIESASGLMNLVMMPMWIFSGVFFSGERFPAMVQPFIKALPLTALNDALRATILEGASLASQSGRILVLVLWGGISFLLALRWFRWT